MRIRIVMFFLACMVATALSMPLNAQTAPAATTDTTVAAAQETVAAPAPAKPAEKIKLMIYDGEKAKVQFYGFIKLDAVYNTTNVAHECGALYVVNQNNKNAAQKSNSLSAEARNTRLGVKFAYPEALGAKLTGAVEVDFWGQMPNSTLAANQGMFRMRHAYMKLAWPTQTSLLVGQFWSAAMPFEVLPTMATFVPMGKCGLLFSREPQVTVSQKVGDDFLSGTLDLSVARVQAGNDLGYGLYSGVKNSQLDEVGAGEASALPGFRGKLIIRTKPIDGLTVLAGASGFFQREDQPYVLDGDRNSNGIIDGSESAETDGITQAGEVTNKYKTLNGYAGAGFLSVNYWLFGIAGHVYKGSNMDSFFCLAGTRAYTDGSKVVALKSVGGWAQGSVDLRPLKMPVKFVAGYGIEDVDEDDAATGAIVKNQCVFGNVFFYANPYLTFAFEVARMESEYKAQTKPSNWSYHAVAQFSF